MKIKKLKEKIILLAFIITGVIVIISCEKEIGVDPIPTERPIQGILVDANDNSIRVSNAIVAITPIDENIDYKTVITTSDDEGFFEITTLVLPSSKPYQVQIDATNSGYMLKDTIVSCDCAVLELNFIKLEKYSCGISISPNFIEFGESFIDVQKSSTVTITNSSELPLNITGINFSNSVFNLQQGSIVFPKYLESGKQTTIIINFAPTDKIEYSDSIIVRTDCDENSDFIALLHGIGESSPCGIQLNPSIINLPNNFVVGDTIKYSVTITGSPEATEPAVVDSIFNPFENSVFFNENELVNIPIQPGEERVFTIFVTSGTEQSLLDSLKFYTSCDDSSYNSLIIDGKSNTRKCDISITYGDLQELGLGQDSVQFSITNLSDEVDLSYTIAPLNDPLSITPWPLQGTLAPSETRYFDLLFDITSLSKDTLQVLTISTNGTCSLDEQLYASFNIPGIKKSTIFRWLPTQLYDAGIYCNPDFRYWGFNFADGKQQPDSISICGSEDPGGEANSNFRFNRISTFFYNSSLDNAISISIHDAWLELPPVNSQFGLPRFDVVLYNSELSQRGFTNFEGGCSIPPQKIDDVFAIRTGEVNNYSYYIVRIYSIDRRRDPTLEFEELTIEYFKYKPNTFIINNNN